MSTALAIFVKTPGLSPVKTRLAARVGEAQATRFHELAAAAVAAVAWAAAGRCPRLVPLWAVAEAAAVAGAQWAEFPRMWQGEGALGERIARIERQLATRYARWLLIGADAPQITVADLLQAMEELQRTHCVLGPSQDGGFWLYGAREPLPAAHWRTLPWSAPDTHARLRDRLRAQGPVASLRVLRDVDTAADLPPLRAALAALADPLPEQVALRDWLRTLR